jgi:hypothetical protein
MEIKTQILENNIGRGWGCGYVFIPLNHPFLVKRLLNNDTYFYPQVEGFSEEITFAENEGDYLQIGFDTYHSWNTPENSPKSFVIEKTEELKKCIESYTLTDAKKEVKNHFNELKETFKKYL